MLAGENVESTVDANDREENATEVNVLKIDFFYTHDLKPILT
jgi:hypothetical protein